MKTPRWIPETAIYVIHNELLAENGGVPGVLNPELLESTLARPRNLLVHEHTDLPALAACYAYGLSSNHCFADGNKGTTLASVDVFLIINGVDFTAEEAEAVAIIVGVAEGSVSEDELADWIRKNIGSAKKRSR